MSRYTTSRQKTALAFYYFDFTNDVKTKASSWVRSIVLQLAEQTADTTGLEALHRAYATGTPPSQELLEVVRSMISKSDRIYIIMDALDECTDQEELFDLLNVMRDWKLDCLSILVTSRDEPDIRECVHPTADQEILLKNPAIDDDIRLFIEETLQKDKKLQVWSELFPEIEESLANGAQGMFRWVDCQMQTLRRCPSIADVKKTLRDLPDTLDKTYERILRSIRPNLCDYALRLLQWLCIADHSIDIRHVMDAFAANIGENPAFDPDARFTSSDKVLALCPGLIIKVREFNAFWSEGYTDRIQIAHYSVKEYLVSDRQPTAPDPLSMFKVREPLANLAMAKTCLIYAIFGPGDLYYRPSSSCGDSDSDSDCDLAPSFAQSAREEWVGFFQRAEKDSRLMELAISYLTCGDIGDINAAFAFAIEHSLPDLEIWLSDHYKLTIDPSLALLTKCNNYYIQSLDFVRFWLERGADVNTQSINRRKEIHPPLGSTPLHLAVYGGSIALAQALLQNGADRKAKNEDGFTPLMAAFSQCYHYCIRLELVELLWFDGGQDDLDQNRRNFLHQVADSKCQPCDSRANNLLQRFAHDEAQMKETITWLVAHGVSPYSKDNEGYTPLHKAALSSNVIAIETLCATTAKSTEYGGCLMAYIENINYQQCHMSIAQSLFEIDPDPFGRFDDSSGLLSRKLKSCKDDSNRASGSGFSALFLEHGKDPAHTKLDLYVSFLDNFLRGQPSGRISTLSWLVSKLVEYKSLDFVGTELWSVALDVESSVLIHGMKPGARERIAHNAFRQVREFFKKRELFGVGIKELYRLLLRRALDRNRLAKLVIGQEPAYAGLELSNDTQMFSYDYGEWREDVFVSLMVHREIHSDTQNEDDDAAILGAITLGEPEMIRLLVKRLLLKRGCDMSHRNGESLTPLEGAVAYLDGLYAASVEILESFLAAGCDGNIQDDAGRTPLMIAVYRGDKKFVEVLLHAGCNANLQDEEGCTPVTEVWHDSAHDGRPVCPYGTYRIVSVSRETLLEHRRNAWKTRFSPVGGYTALMYAVLVGRIDIVELLLQNRCDVELVDNLGRTALDLAKQFHKDEILKVLLDHEQYAQCAQ